MNTMRAVQVVGYHEGLKMTEAPIPEVAGAWDVAGVSVRVCVRAGDDCDCDFWAVGAGEALPLPK